MKLFVCGDADACLFQRGKNQKINEGKQGYFFILPWCQWYYSLKTGWSWLIAAFEPLEVLLGKPSSEPVHVVVHAGVFVTVSLRIRVPCGSERLR